MIWTKTKVRLDTLSFIIAEFIAAAMDLDVRTFAENPESRSIYIPIFALI
jgi:predicted membrane protein